MFIIMIIIMLVILVVCFNIIRIYSHANNVVVTSMY